MSNKKQVRIGLVGRGLMGKMHANAYKRIPNFFPDLEYQPVLQAVASRNEEKVKEFAETWGFQSYETDWRPLVEREDRKSTRLNSSHVASSYAVFCVKKETRTSHG